MTFQRLWQTAHLWFYSRPEERGEYIRRNKLFGAAGKHFSFMPRILPLYPQLIRIHDNVRIASGVHFVTHDGTHNMLNNCTNLFRGNKIPELVGCIEIMDNVFVGAHAILLPNIRIGPNVIIGAGSLVTKDCIPDSVYAGVPAKRIGNFVDFVKSRQAGNFAYTEHNQHITAAEVERAWTVFEIGHMRRDVLIEKQR